MLYLIKGVSDQMKDKYMHSFGPKKIALTLENINIPKLNQNLLSQCTTVSLLNVSFNPNWRAYVNRGGRGRWAVVKTGCPN